MIVSVLCTAAHASIDTAQMNKYGVAHNLLQRWHCPNCHYAAWGTHLAGLAQRSSCLARVRGSRCRVFVQAGPRMALYALAIHKTAYVPPQRPCNRMQEIDADYQSGGVIKLAEWQSACIDAGAIGKFTLL